MGIFGRAADLLDPPADPWLDDPAGWVRHRLDDELWSKQVEILESVRDHRRTAVPSCHGAGKSWIAARAVAHWLECHPPGSAFVVTTAPFWDQVRAILWREIGKAHRKGNLVGRVNQTEWHIGGEMVAYGRKPPDQAEAGFQGIHAEFVLVVADEAAGIPEVIWTGILSLLTTIDCRVLAIGNPDYEGSRFSKMCAPGSGWNVIRIDGLETPNFTGEPKPKNAPLLDQAWIDDLVHDFGIDSPQYLAKVRAVFPADRTDGVIPWSAAHACRAPDHIATLTPLRIPVELGVDVGGGTDMTVIRERRGPVTGRVWRVNTEDSERIVTEVVKVIKETGATAVKVDYGGIGFGVVGALRREVERLPAPPVVHAVLFGEQAKDPEKYENVRAEMYWEMRLALMGRAYDLAACDERTMADLVEARWFETVKGRIQIERKAEIQKRLGRSPDDADALVLAFYDPPEDAPPVTSTRYENQALWGTR